MHDSYRNEFSGSDTGYESVTFHIPRPDYIEWATRGKPRAEEMKQIFGHIRKIFDADSGDETVALAQTVDTTITTFSEEDRFFFKLCIRKFSGACLYDVIIQYNSVLRVYRDLKCSPEIDSASQYRLPPSNPAVFSGYDTLVFPLDVWKIIFLKLFDKACLMELIRPVCKHFASCYHLPRLLEGFKQLDMFNFVSQVEKLHGAKIDENGILNGAGAYGTLTSEDRVKVLCSTASTMDATLRIGKFLIDRSNAGLPVDDCLIKNFVIGSCPKQELIRAMFDLHRGARGDYRPFYFRLTQAFSEMHPDIFGKGFKIPSKEDDYKVWQTFISSL